MEKIVLGQKKFIGNQNSDEFIEVELKREIESLKTEILYNTFDFQSQFIKERNNSLKFCLYGLIESKYGHCDNLNLNISVSDTNKDSGSTNSILYSPYKLDIANTGYSFNIISKPLSQNSDLSKNIYGTNKGCYFFYFEIDRNDINFNKNKSIYISIFEPIQELYGYFELPFIFFDENRELIEFGTENADFNDSNEIETINNNFPFFYDKHWIKFNLEPYGPQVVSFQNDVLRVSESVSSVSIPISLEKPSEFGLERVKVLVDYNQDSLGNLLTTATLGSDFYFNEQVISWNQGEKIKYINININNDLFVENIEKIQLRIQPLINARISENSNNSMVLYIDSEDVPVSAYFRNDFIETYRPLYTNNPLPQNSPFQSLLNSIDDFISSTINVTISFSSPLPVDGEKIKIKYNNISTAKIGSDFGFDNLYSNVDEIELNVPLSSTSIDFNLFIKSHKGYIEDRLIILDLVQSTLGIIPVSLSPRNNFPQIKINIKDSTLPLFTRFSIPINYDRSIGVFKKIFTTNSTIDNYLYLKKDILDSSLPRNQNQHNLTNNFYCEIEVKNLGETIFYNNQKISTNETITIPLNLSSITNNFNIDLPSNLNWRGLYYDKSNYEFKFKNIERTYPATTNNNQNYDIYNLREQDIMPLDNYQVYDSGLSAQTTYWFITEIKNSYSTLDTTNNQCLNSANFFNSSSLFYNGAIIGSFDFLYQKTISTIKISKKRAVEVCGGNGSFLPVGTTLLPPPPYNEKYCNINFGEILIQLQYSLPNVVSEMYLQKIFLNSQRSINNSFRYFVDFDSAFIETKNSLRFEIFNNGIRDIEFMGKTIPYNSSAFFNGSELDFTNLSLTLPANDIYESNGNFFKRFRYKFKFYNIKIPHSLLNNTNFETIPEYEIAEFDFPLVQNQGGFNFPQNFYIENKYNNIGLSADIFGNLNCSVAPFLSFSHIIRKIVTNRILIFSNTGSNLIDTIWANSPINSDCNNATIPFKIV